MASGEGLQPQDAARAPGAVLQRPRRKK